MVKKILFNHKTIESKWQRKWGDSQIYSASDFSKNKKFYLLVEYPYPSGEGLHIGHAFTNTIGDIYARYLRMKGFNVLFPMGWDSFGLPTENSAIKLGIHPSILTKRNTTRFRQQNKSLGMSFDWGREIDTSSPDYYRWTQWIFLQLFKHGLAYKSEAKVGWCPKCKIILSNEEIIAGKCERCGAEIEYRKQKQWILKITAYADRLSKELDLVKFPSYVKKSQRDWIGRKEWIDITYEIEGTKEKIVVSTTRPETNFGATFVVIAPEHPILSKLEIPSQYQKKLAEYIKKAQNKSELERISEGKIKTGVFIGRYCINRLNGKKLPIWVADFVLMSVGTGAVVGVPGHDRRDFEFAKQFKLPIVRVIVGEDKDTSEITTASQVQEKDGQLINSDFLNGLSCQEGIHKIMDYLENKRWGKRVIRYHLRDWIFSRQHYWGEPIPIIHCSKCGLVPVPENQLPVKLPDVKKYEPTDTGESPLAKIATWVNTTCPKCRGRAKRETDTMPNWAGSSWYYLRFLDPKNNRCLADRSKLDYWLPVDIYIGGAEHTTLHILYSRFWHKFLNDIKSIPGKEPYLARRQHGVILGEGGMRMSKSRGNVINPLIMAEKFGTDTLRLYLMFMGPYDSTMVWNTEGIEGMRRFIDKLWKLFQQKNSEFNPEDEKTLNIKLQQTIKKITEDIEQFKYNTAIAQLMILVNFFKENGVTNQAKKVLCQLIAPFAPYFAEEVWVNILNQDFSVHKQNWPQFNKNILSGSKKTIVVQVNGKVRDQIGLTQEGSENQKEVERVVQNSPKSIKWLQGKKLRKTVFVAGKLINFVVD